MNKENQSIIDFLGVMPFQGPVLRAPVNNKEAEILYKIWNSDKDDFGRYFMPKDAGISQVSSLVTKGMIRNLPRAGLILEDQPQLVEITDKGRNIIRNIILHTEKSAFEKAGSGINYEAIHRAVLNGTTVKEADKVASKVKTGGNWLQRIWK